MSNLDLDSHEVVSLTGLHSFISPSYSVCLALSESCGAATMSIPTKPPFEVITPDDRGAPVSIVNCILIIISGIVVIARGLTRLTITKLKAVDDVAIGLTLVSLSLGQHRL